MAQVVESDRSGRIVIPKNVRDALGIRGRTRFLLVERGEGQLILQRLEVDEIARRLEKELAGRDVNSVVRRVKQEVRRRIEARYPGLLG